MAADMFLLMTDGGTTAAARAGHDSGVVRGDVPVDVRV